MALGFLPRPPQTHPEDQNATLLQAAITLPSPWSLQWLPTQLAVPVLASLLSSVLRSQCERISHESEDPTAQTCLGSPLTQRTSQALRHWPVGPDQWASLPPSASSTLTPRSQPRDPLAFPSAWNVLRQVPAGLTPHCVARSQQQPRRPVSDLQCLALCFSTARVPM